MLAHARALLTGTSQGPVAYLHADLCVPGVILRGASRTLDFSQPVALMMLMVLHMIPDAGRPLWWTHEIPDPGISHWFSGSCP